MGVIKTVCVYCGASSGARPAYAAAAGDFAGALVRRGISLVYGGGSIGLMGALADAMLAAGGKVTGVIPRPLAERELAHRGLTALEVTDSMHARKARMAALADAFVALPGGIGTLEELFEMWTWAQLGLHAKPCGLLDVAGYYGRLVEFLDHATRERFLDARYRAILRVASDPEALLDALMAFTPPAVEPWLREGQT